MNCTCGAFSVASDIHSDWCDNTRHITVVAKRDMVAPRTRYLYVTCNGPVPIFTELREYFKDATLMCMDFNGTCSICFKNSSEIYFISKNDLSRETLKDFDGAYVEKSSDQLNVEKHLKPLAPIKYVENSLVI